MTFPGTFPISLVESGTGTPGGIAVCGAPASIATLSARLDEAVAQGFHDVTFIDFELLAHPDRKALVRAVVARGLTFGMATHGRGLRREVAAGLRRTGLRRVEVTLHGGSAYPYYLATQIHGWGEALSGIETAARAGLAVDVVVPVNRFSRGSLRNAVVAMEQMPPGVSLRFEPDGLADYAAEIQDGTAYRALLRGESDPTVPSGGRFVPTGQSVDVDLAACPYRRSGSLAEDPLRHMLVRSAEGSFQVYRLSDPMPDSVVRVAKNVRGLVFAGGDPARRLALESECRTCRQLTDCHAAFFDLGTPAPRPTLAAADVAVDLVSSTASAGMRHLRSAMADLPAGKRLRVAGRVPCLAIGADAPEPKPLPDIGIGVIADLAQSHGLSIVDYHLPHETAGGDFDAVFERRDSRVSERRSERTAVLMVSSACVGNCVMCSMPQTFAGHAVPLPRALPLLEEVKLCGFTAVDIFGGEIMLRLDLPVLIELAKRLNLYVMIISTGYGIDEASLGRMVEAGLDKIEIAIDAPNAELHDFIKGRRGLFDHAVRAVRAARENPRVYVEVNTVVLPENFRYLPQLHRFIASELHGHRQHLFYVTHPPSSLVRPRWLDEAQAREYFEVVKPELERIEAELGTHIDFCPSVEPGDFASPEALYKNFSRGCYLGESRRCAAPEQDLMVLPDGEVYACNSPMVIHSQTAIGNMATHRLIDCLSGGPMARWLREAGTWPECESCIARR